MDASLENKTGRKQYGLLTMVAIIVGTVIGSGIFVKNTELISTTNSALLSMIGWIIGGLIVVSMLVAFIEVSSITKLKNEQGTFSAWSKYLWGEKLSKYIGVYFTLIYFPLIIAIETIFASNQLLGIFGMQEMSLFWTTTVITIIIIIVAFLIVNHSQRTGKGLIASGTMIKVIPLFSVMLIALIILAGGHIEGTNSTLDGVNNIFDPNDPINMGMTDDSSNILQILMILPAILFAFDGFLFANSLSTETKKPSTYRNAAIIGVFIITMVYILFSLSSYMLADINDGLDDQKFGIEAIFSGLWPGNAGTIIGKAIEITIFISIITSTFSYAVSSTWSIADFSNINEIADVNGTLIRRNKVGMPIRAGMRMLMMALVFTLFIRMADGINILTLNAIIDSSEAGWALTEHDTSMNNYSSNIATMTNFTLYSIILIGAVRNRFTKKVEVEKSTGFFVFSFFAIIVMIFAVGDLAYVAVSDFIEAFNILFGEGTHDLTSSELAAVIYNAFGFILWIIFFMLLIILTETIHRGTKKLTKSHLKHKAYYQKAYNKHIIFSEYKIQHKQPINFDHKELLKIKREIWTEFISKNKKF